MDKEADVRTAAFVFDRLGKLEEHERLTMKLDIAESVAMAYLGCRTNEGNREYRRWKRSLVREANKLMGYKEKTIWDGKSRRL